MDPAKLEDLCAHKNIPIVGRYHALGDAKITANSYKNFHDVYYRFPGIWKFLFN